MNSTTDEALRAESTRLRLNPQIERAARAALDIVLASAYDHRPEEKQALSPEQYEAQLTDEAVVAVYTYTALHLSGQYARAAAHVLHTLDRALAVPPSGPPAAPAGRPRARIGWPRGGVFHAEPGLADIMPGLEAEVRDAAEYLNGFDYGRADTMTLAIASRLAGGGLIGSTYAVAVARHLVETQAQHLGDGARDKSAD
ncbi:hypothetical protein [Kitasatospora sp. NPDC058478]|uniref:hypothetical protein n=1 Tax=unclassified Kitasatospora TaxID=2633591 RepID=UPI003655FEA3